MDEIKLIRLQCGTDIICEYLNIGNSCFIKNPMTAFMDYTEDDSTLILKHWSPVELIEMDDTIMDIKDVLCVFTPTEQLIEFYTRIVSEEDDDVMDSVDDIIDKNNNRIH